MSQLFSGKDTSLKWKKFETITCNDIINANNVAKQIIEESIRENINVISFYDSIFPDSLRYAINETKKLDPPLLLWYKGNISAIKLPGIAIIGTRQATPEGKAGATYISEEFAKKGFNIISGLALGCDTYGHKGALKVGGKTTAFLANGLDINSIYPSENKKLAEEIIDSGGLLLSEYSIRKTVNRFSLVARDRLQASLALATLVVQTGINGGTMHAAKVALLSGKPLYAMKFKSSIINNHERCQGNSYLVKLGAKYISGCDDINEICQEIKNCVFTRNSLF